jgi:serine protease Do
MRLVKFLGALAIGVGLVAAAVVYAPAAFGQVVVSRPGGPEAMLQVLDVGGSRIGISIRDVDRADVEREKLPGQWGAVIEEVRSGSPAERAGLKAGDVVVDFDGERVRSARQLSRLVEETPAGRTVKAAVMRAGRRVDVDLVPERASGYLGPSGDAIARLNRDFRLDLEPLRRDLDRLRDLPVPPFEFGGILRTPRLGISAEALTPQLARYFGVEAGVLVTSVTDDSAAAVAGLKAGDVITAIDGGSVESVSELRSRLQRLDAGDEFEIGIVRDRKTMTLKGRLGDEHDGMRIRRRVITGI